MKKGLRTVKEMLLSENKYFIPAFQRGYRWDKEQVDDLLKDLHSFYSDYVKPLKGKSGALDKTNIYYCLQSVIVSKEETEEGAKNSVIDGQQRLTTTYIMICCLNNIGTGGFSVDDSKTASFTYGSRKKNDKYLQSMKNGEPDKHFKTRDQKHMYEAYQEIKKVCTDGKIDDIKCPGIAKELAELIEGDWIKFIEQVYKDKTPVDVFEAINYGKIPLTDAELIRAKIILKGYSNKTEERAKKWDEMEHALQNDSMFRFLTKKEVHNASRIGLLFELMVLRALEEMDAEERKKVNKDEKHWVYRFLCKNRFTGKEHNDFNLEDEDTFENADSIDIFWAKAEDLYEAIYKWYKDVELYNYIGQIMYSGSADLCDIYIKYFETGSRDEFIWELKKYILSSFNNISIDRKPAPIWPDNFPEIRFKDLNKCLTAEDTIDLSQLLTGNQMAKVNEWSSDDDTIATVDDKGTVTFTGAEGGVNITAKNDKGNTIVTISLLKLKVDNTELTIPSKDLKTAFGINGPGRIVGVTIGDEYGYDAEYDGSDLKIKSLGDVIVEKPVIDNEQLDLAEFSGINDPEIYKWSPSDRNIATVNNKGVVTGKSTGNVTVRAKDKYTGSVKIDSNVAISDSGWSVDGKSAETKDPAEKKKKLLIRVGIDNDKLASLFGPLYYSGRPKDPIGIGFRDQVKYFLVWSNCELLKSQMLKAREEKGGRRSDSDEMYRFPFSILISQGVEVEHVDSYLDRAEQDDHFKKDDAEKSIEFMEPYLTEDQRSDVDNAGDDWVSKYNKILEFFLDDKFNLEDDPDKFETTIIDRRGIGNLVLLDPSTNHGYGNNPFYYKRGSILSKKKEGQYYYPCTQMVFLKEFEPLTPDLVRWNRNDYMEYFCFLLNQFVDCFYKDGEYIG